MPKSRRRKRTPSRPRARLTWQAKVLADARPLLAPSATRHEAELWASAKLGRAAQGSGLLRRSARDAWVTQVLAYAGRRRTPTTAAVVLTLRAVAIEVGLVAWAEELLTDYPSSRTSRPCGSRGHYAVEASQHGSFLPRRTWHRT